MFEEEEKNRNGVFLYNNNSFKRISISTLKNKDLICFGGGNNVKMGYSCKYLGLQGLMSRNTQREKELEIELQKLKDTNEYLQNLNKKSKLIKTNE